MDHFNHYDVMGEVGIKWNINLKLESCICDFMLVLHESICIFSI